MIGNALSKKDEKTHKNAPLIGSAQAAKRFGQSGVDRATFNRWVAEGLIPVAIEVEGKTGARLFDADLIDAIAERSGGKKPKAAA